MMETIRLDKIENGSKFRFPTSKCIWTKLKEYWSDGLSILAKNQNGRYQYFRYWEDVVAV